MDEMTPHAPPQAYRLTLYTAGLSPIIEAAAERIRQWCAEHAIPLQLTLIDVLEQPQRAVQERIYATPALVREAPPPERRVIGDLSATQTIMRLLQMPGAG